MMTATAPRFTVPGFWGDAASARVEEIDWLFDGYLAAGRVTLLTSLWKSGKTTLLSILLGRMREGGMLADRPVKPCKAMVISEESEPTWQPRLGRLNLGHVYFVCQPYLAKPSPDEWRGLLDHAATMHREHGIRLVVVDTLTTFLPGGNEASAGAVMNALLPLVQLTRLGLAVLLLHHPRKAASEAGYAARGSGAFAGFADIVLEMSTCPRALDDDRRRRILALSRSPRTPRQLVIELNAEATDYRSCGDFLADDFSSNWDVLRAILENADDRLTRKEIMDAWPQDVARPDDVTLWRWLKRAVDVGLVALDGPGTRVAPHRYWLPAKAKEWSADPMRQLHDMIEQHTAEQMRMIRAGEIGVDHRP
jgi:hypothetical protein